MAIRVAAVRQVSLGSSSINFTKLQNSKFRNLRNAKYALNNVWWFG